MKNLKIFLIFLAITSFSTKTIAQQIENLRIKTLEDKLNLIYDISHEKAGQLFDIKVLCSDNEGQNFNIPLTSVSGDYGNNVEGGKDKIIIWDVLKDRKNLKGENYVFKIIASPGKVVNQTDHAESFHFELVDCYKKDKKIVCALKITNKGKERDLKIINRLARVYDFKGKNIAAQYSKLGRVQGDARYAAPTLTFQPNQTDIALFSFNIPDSFSNRIKMLEFGVEILEITYGLDLKTGNIQFRDISFDNPQESAKTELISQATNLNIGPELTRTVDTKPPQISFSNPQLTKDKATVVNTEEVIVHGKVTDENGIFELTINGMSANLKDNGNFESDIYLVGGKNNIFVRATDKFNNSIEETYAIVYQPLYKQDQRQTSINKNDPSVLDEKTAKEGKYYALLIGVNEYPDPEIMNLDQPVTDAQKLYNTLTTKYTFEKENVKLLQSPTREQIISELDRLNRVITEDDNLLVFYAGHGYWDKQDEVGYWLPSDSKKANTANWMRNTTIRDYLRTVKTKHTLLVADACFSGGIFKTRKAFADAPKSVQKLYEVPSRKAMTSGTLKEVPDRSVFLLYLNKRLSENTKPYISAEEVFSSFKIAVLNNSPNIPQYGEIKDTGDEGGDFIFIKRAN
ncbi:MAG: caspase family protein [Bacteroidales bacterium]|nr:caspase family protein [Bacteroidales bacterium]